MNIPNKKNHNFSTGDNMTVDFHYQTANIVKYRTDVTFGWLDLMVSFGGIAGLFLGCSILSGVEIIYYALIIALMMTRKLLRRIEVFLKPSNKIKINEPQPKLQKFSKKVDNVQVIKIQSLSDLDNNMKDSNKSRY